MNEYWLALAILVSCALSYWLGMIAGDRRACRRFNEWLVRREPPVDSQELNKQICKKEGHALSPVRRICYRCHAQFAPDFLPLNHE